MRANKHGGDDMSARATSRSALLALACALLAAACAERETVTDPELSGPQGLIALTCTASVVAQTLSCQPPDGRRVDGGPQMLIVGGQNINVKLFSDNVAFTPDVYGQDIGQFTADVTVTNLMSQPLGTPDGTTPTGIRVFFHTPTTVTDPTPPDPVGGAACNNCSGSFTCTASNQRFHAYPATAANILGQDETSEVKLWSWRVDETGGEVNVFEFTVFVEADTPGDIDSC